MNTSKSTTKPRFVHCPTCGKPVAWAEENRYRPFCSPRCKGVDLGAWAAEDYRVPVQDEQPFDTSEPD